MRAWTGLIAVATGVLLTPAAWAQWTGPIQTFTSNVDAEEVAPLPSSTQPVPAQPAPAEAVSATAPVTSTSPFTVSGLVITLSDTTGFARDAALDKAARVGLPKVLERLPMEPAKAASSAKAVGDAQRFVASYVIVKETLIPTYSLTVDMTYNEGMIRANFGGVKAAAVSATAAVGLDSPTLVPAPVPHTFVVRLANGDPGSQDRVYKKLREPAGASIKYRVATSEGAEWDVSTPLDRPALEAAVAPLGASVVSPLPLMQAPVASDGAVSASVLNPAEIY